MLTKLLHSIETSADNAKHLLNRLSGMRDAFEIHPYIGYANETGVVLSGRLLETERKLDINRDARALQNLLSATRSWLTDEVPDGEVTLTIGDETFHTRTDEEGYFHFDIESTAGKSHPGGELLLELKADYPDHSGDLEAMDSAKAIARVMLPPESASLGIISDIDDTVVETGATRLLQMLQNTLFKNHHTRSVFPGVSALYNALHLGSSGADENPFFYVTSSPWNLFPMLTEIFRLQRIPPGPLFMTDWGLTEETIFSSSHHDHKSSAIERLLSFYPDLPFLLIGDSGQKDPEIYTSIIESHPDRIRAIYIRDVSEGERDAEVEKLATRCATSGIELILSADSVTMAKHAARHGWIREADIHRVSGDAKADQEEA